MLYWQIICSTLNLASSNPVVFDVLACNQDVVYAKDQSRLPLTLGFGAPFCRAFGQFRLERFQATRVSSEGSSLFCLADPVMLASWHPQSVRWANRLSKVISESCLKGGEHVEYTLGRKLTKTPARAPAQFILRKGLPSTVVATLVLAPEAALTSLTSVSPPATVLILVHRPLTLLALLLKWFSRHNAAQSGPSISALAAQQQMQHPSFVPPQPKAVTLFVGSISGGITDAFLNEILKACGPIISFKRLITPANKPQGFGFAEFQDPDGALRAMTLLNGVELPALEDGCVNKKLLVKADERTKTFLDAYQAQKMRTDVSHRTITELATLVQADDEALRQAKARVDELLADINKKSQEAASNGLIDREKYVIPPHLHDLQEADLPETQRGLVMTEIAQFRERAFAQEGHGGEDGRGCHGHTRRGCGCIILELARGRGWDYEQREAENSRDDERRPHRKFTVGEPEMGLADVEWVIVDEADVLFGKPSLLLYIP
ncbi:hypothetical protein NUW54_g12881 [Trametes sanguinea]|uniref:Uncharacterized protein n=1 Tax=Trametes sanguinea TaxID=158606 RepID=A0ACC1MSZ7_9APHY|nr:hypothetical protein NUW54_g12881 [Trametes sanguinea]